MDTAASEHGAIGFIRVSRWRYLFHRLDFVHEASQWVSLSFVVSCPSTELKWVSGFGLKPRWASARPQHAAHKSNVCFFYCCYTHVPLTPRVGPQRLREHTHTHTGRCCTPTIRQHTQPARHTCTLTHMLAHTLPSRLQSQHSKHSCQNSGTSNTAIDGWICRSRGRRAVDVELTPLDSSHTPGETFASWIYIPRALPSTPNTPSPRTPPPSSPPLPVTHVIYLPTPSKSPFPLPQSAPSSL